MEAWIQVFHDTAAGNRPFFEAGLAAGRSMFRRVDCRA
jgi:hypothetical protein